MSAFKAGDLDNSGVLDAQELKSLVLPSGWDAHLRRRDLHALGIFLHTWLAEDSDWDASRLRSALDNDPADGRVSLSEWTRGILRLCREREVKGIQDILHGLDVKDK